MKNSKAVVSIATEETLALLRENFPTDQGFTRTLIPRLGMVSQDKTEGKGKMMKVIAEAGTFYIEDETEEENENGKKIWAKTELGDTIEGIIIYQRKQLKFYDKATETFVSSPIFDSADDIVPLFSQKKEIARGTSAELKSRPEYQFEKDGKIKSKLEDNKVLYVLFEGELYQMTLRGSSMYSYMSYAKTINPSTVVTTFCSEPKEQGQVAWNQMTFKKKSALTEEEALDVIDKQEKIKNAVKFEKAYFTSIAAAPTAEQRLEKF